LDRGRSDSAGPGMDEHGFARLHPPELEEAVVRSAERHRDARGFVRAESVRNMPSDTLRDNTPLGVRPIEAHRDHTLTGAELVDAVNALLDKARIEGTLDHLQVKEEDIASKLYTANVPDPDLLIRTSGEMRISNFLLWQIAYAEIYVTETLWPDFKRSDLLRAILEYQKRDRRFGGVKTDVAPDAAEPVVEAVAVPAR